MDSSFVPGTLPEGFHAGQSAEKPTASPQRTTSFTEERNGGTRKEKKKIRKGSFEKARSRK